MTVMKHHGKERFQFKLLAIIFTSLLVGLVLAGGVLYFQFRAFLYHQIETVLQDYANLADQSLSLTDLREKNIAALKAFVDRTSRNCACRVTVIDTAGIVLADSEVSMDQLYQVENHLSRPEVQAALKQEFGFAVRRSNTLDLDLLYLSKQVFHNGEPIGFLRLALFATQTNALLKTTQKFIVIGALLAFLFSTLLAAFLSRRFQRSMRELTEKAQRIAMGEFRDLRLKLSGEIPGNELEQLGKNLDEMAVQLSENLRRLSRERRELRMVLASINDGILAISPEKKVVFHNERALHLLKSEAKAADGMYYYDVIRNQHLNWLIATFLEKPFLISDEVEVQTDRILDVVLTPFEVENQHHEGAVVVLRDISQYKQLEKIRRDFVANVSHEFKTPLAAIRGYAETLLDWGLEDRKVNRKYVEKIIRQSHQLENLVMDLLQLARVERLNKIELLPFDPVPIVHEVLNEYLEKAREKRQDLTGELPLSGLRILGDPEMFRSIMGNLVDNAVKYTPPGGKIRIAAQLDERYGIFSVQDNGIGIPVQEQGRIFERFYRVDKARSQKIEGTGLGLSIVKHMAELQQAEVWLQSRVNVGSCFYLKFKLASSAGPAN